MKTVRFIILILVICLAFASVNAESLFSLLQTSAPVPQPIPIPTPSQTPKYKANNEREGSLFDQLITPSCTPQSTEAPATLSVPDSASASALNVDPEECFKGYGYGQITGQKASTTYYKNDGIVEVVFRDVAQESFDEYDKYLEDSGFYAYPMETESQNTVAYGATNETERLAFMVVYQPDISLLTLVYFPYIDDDAQDDSIEENTQDISTEVNTQDAQKTAPKYSVCPNCNKGHCRTCNGRGIVKCGTCAGLGSCRICHGKRGTTTPGYGGVGTSEFVECSYCNGTGRCEDCNGAGRVECGDCDRGICLTCGGNYKNPN